MLIDLGASVSAIPHYLYMLIPVAKRPKLTPISESISGGNGIVIECYGAVALTVSVNDISWTQTFRICDNNTQGLFGKDFLDFHNVAIQCGKIGKLFMHGKQITLFDHKGRQFSSRATLPRTYRIPPGQRAQIQAKIINATGDMEGQTVIIEPSRRFRMQTGLLAGRVTATVIGGCVPIELYNPGDEVRSAPKGLTPGVATPIVSAHRWDAFKGINPADMPEASINCIKAAQFNMEEDVEVPAHLQTMYEKNSDNLGEVEDKQFRKLLVDYGDIFAKDGYDLGKCNTVKHHIDTGDERPVKRRTRRMPQAHFEECEHQIVELEKAGRIKPSNSPWGANVLLVKKKDGSWRMCIDYRELNTKTKNVDPYLLPRIDDTIDALGSAKYFCTLDLIQGYHQVELTEESKPKTAFLVPRMIPSQWEFNYMPFGVQGGPSTFQRLMDQLLKGLEHRIALAYLDDIIVFGASPMECVGHLRTVFARIRAANLKLKPKKCEFFKKELLYLGHVVSGDGIKCDPAKIEAVKNWAVPRTSRQTRSFLGVVNYYHRFIPNFAHHAQALFEVTSKKRNFKWSNECQIAFDTLRQRLTEAPIMAYPLPEGRFILDTDASGYAIGGVLSQEQRDEEGNIEERVISYGSRTLQKCERRYCTRRRELLAIVHFVKHFKPYLYGRECLIRTDHASLRYIKKLKDPNEQFSRWIETLEETLYTIEIRAGKLHANADGLSRLIPCTGRRCICEGVHVMEDTGELQDDYKFESAVYDADSEDEAEVHPPQIIACRLSGPRRSRRRRRGTRVRAMDQNQHTDEWVEEHAFCFDQLWTPAEMAEEQATDPDIALLYDRKINHGTRPVWEELSGGSAALASYSTDWDRLFLENEMLYRRFESRDGTEFHMQLLLPYKYQELMAKHFHDAPTAAHMGKRRTHHQVHKRAYWYRMADDLKTWIQTCDVCQRRKRPGVTPKAPKKVYHAGTPNHRVSMDICGPLVKTDRGNRVIMVITDDFSKFTRAFALPNHKAVTIADTFQSGWVSLFGAPREVHSDRGPEFESHLFRQLCGVFKCMKTRTTAYHPSSDGQVERFNQTMTQMLNALTKVEKKDWDLQLKYACQAYNATKHNTTGVEPNRIWFTYPVYMPFDVMIPAPPADEERGQRAYVREVQRQMRRIYQLARTKTGHSATVMKKLGDRAATKHHYEIGDIVLMKNYRLVPGIKKLQDRYIGPYFVLDRLGDQTLRVARGPKDKPDVVHYDRLKPYYAREPSDTDTDWVFQRSWTRFDCSPVDTKETQTASVPPEVVEESETAPEMPLTDEEISQWNRVKRAESQATREEYYRRTLLAIDDVRGVDDGTPRQAEAEEQVLGATRAPPDGHGGRNEGADTKDEGDITTEITVQGSDEEVSNNEEVPIWSERKTVTIRRPDPELVSTIRRHPRGRPRKVAMINSISCRERPGLLQERTYSMDESFTHQPRGRIDSCTQTERCELAPGLY